MFYPASHFHQYILFLAALFVVAIGIVTLQVSTNYITALGSEHSAASRLTLIQGVGSVGTTLAPVFGAHFILSKVNASQGSGVLVKPLFADRHYTIACRYCCFLFKMPKVTSKKHDQEKVLSVIDMLGRFSNLNMV